MRINQHNVKAPRMDFHNIGGQIDYFWPIFDQVLLNLGEYDKSEKGKKCGFFKHEVKFLGGIVGRDGYRMDEDSAEALTALKDFTSTTIGRIRNLLCLLGYHRRNVKNFARLAKSLTDLLVIKPTKSSTKSQVSSKKKIVWTLECQTNLKDIVQ